MELLLELQIMAAIARQWRRVTGAESTPVAGAVLKVLQWNMLADGKTKSKLQAYRNKLIRLPRKNINYSYLLNMYSFYTLPQL